MKQIRVNLQTVTPMFLAGAEPRGEPELRPPAFRGAMRYWLRAALGGVIGDQDTQSLYKLESQVFGSAADGDSSASAVNVRLSMDNHAMVKIPYSELCKYNKERNSYGLSGLSYLLFSARPTKGRDPQPERIGLGGEFDLVLAQRLGNKDVSCFERAYSALWLLSRFGGIGNRAHRGIGAFSVKDFTCTGVDDLTSTLPLVVKAQTTSQLVNELKIGIETSRQIMGAGLPVTKISSPSAFDVLEASVCKIWVIDREYPDGVSALEKFGQIYQGFRSRRPPDYSTVKNSLTFGKELAQPVQRAAFGLPIPYFYRSLDNEQATLQSKNTDRRASPLWVRPVRLATNKVVLVLVWFNSQFLPDNEQLRLKPQKNWKSDAYGPAPDNSLIKKFITGKDEVKQSSLADMGLKVLEVPYA
jgi:CRISPR-associated protein Cmr1